jgi:hypothetical protein
MKNSWNLHQDKYFKKRFKRLGYRRHQAFLKPLARRLTLGQPIPWVENTLVSLERHLNRYVTDRHGRRFGSSPVPD